MVARVWRRSGSLGPILVAIALAVAAFFTWRVLFPSDAQRIHARIGELATAVNTRSSDGIGRLADAARMLSFFTADVVIEPGAPYAPIHGRQALVAVLGRASEPGGFTLAFEDVSVEVAPSGTDATARMTATLTWTNARTGERSLDAREIEVDLREIDGEWTIAGARAIDTLERPPR